MSKPPWVIGQSGNPNGRGRPMRLRREGTTGALARAIGRERVTFTDTAPPKNPPAKESAQARACAPEGDDAPETETAVYTRIERVVRVLWTKAAAGDLATARFLVETMDGKPGRPVRDAGGTAGGGPAADDMARQLSLLDLEDETWRNEAGQCDETGQLDDFGKNG